MGGKALLQNASLAFLFSIAIFMHILSCALYDNFWPLIILIAYAIMPIPLCLYARSAGDSAFDSGSSKAAQHWAEFTTTTLVSLVVGLPLVLWHVHVIELGAALMDIAGFLLVAMTGGLYALYARADAGDSWGGGVSLFGS